MQHNFLKTFLVFSVAALLAASFSYASENLLSDELQKASPINDSIESNFQPQRKYESYLSLEYMQFSRFLASSGEVELAKFFGDKGLKSSSGNEVYPENPTNWKVDPQQYENMIFMQKRLDVLLNKDEMRTKLPIQMAHLTYLYDCWITRESSPAFANDDIAKCRTRFNRLLDEVEQYADSPIEKKVEKSVIEEPVFKRFDILFDLDKQVFNDKANRDMLKILQYIKTLNGEYHILLVGNADRSGSIIHNQALAQIRVHAVQNALIKNGIFKHLIETRAFGENFPDIITQDGAQEITNRIVAVYVIKGYVDLPSLPLPLIDNIVYREQVLQARQERGLSNE